MYSGRGFPGILLGIFLRPFTCPVSGQLEKNAFRTSLISCAFDSPQMRELHPSQAGVDIVATTLWLGP
jgi:hypothetical protein